MAKEQKVLLKKKTSPKEESKKMISMKNLAESLQPPEIHEEEEESAKSFEFFFLLSNAISLHKVPKQPNLVMKTIRHPSLPFLFDPQRDELPNKPYHIDGDPKMSIFRIEIFLI